MADAFTNCFACKHSGMEPDDRRLFCMHPDSGTFGKYLTSQRQNPSEAKPLPHCGGKKFEQHPNRNRDGSLKL